MKLARCPICHSNIHLDQLVADEAGRQLLGVMSKLNYRMGPALVSYLAMFRPAKQDLSNAKALNLATDTLALTTNHAVLAEALQDTVSSLQASRQNAPAKQLTNHNYLKKVLAAKLGDAAVKATGTTVELKHQTTLSKEAEQAAFEERMKLLGGNIYGKVPNDSN